MSAMPPPGPRQGHAHSLTGWFETGAEAAAALARLREAGLVVVASGEEALRAEGEAEGVFDLLASLLFPAAGTAEAPTGWTLALSGLTEAQARRAAALIAPRALRIEAREAEWRGPGWAGLAYPSGPDARQAEAQGGEVRCRLWRS